MANSGSWAHCEMVVPLVSVEISPALRYHLVARPFRVAGSTCSQS